MKNKIKEIIRRIKLILGGFLILVMFSAGAEAEVTLDTDGDLLPDGWELERGFDTNNPADADLDPDGDRLSNRDEFFANTNPIVYTAANDMLDCQLFNLFKGKAFLFFWEQSRPPYYFTPDKANYTNSSDFSDNFNSIATTGFSIMAYVVADEYGWVSHQDAYWRIHTLLKRAVEMQDPRYDQVGVPPSQQGNRHGYLYHFVDNQGFRNPGSEISTIDHALFVAGALVAAEYYKGTEVEQLARQLFLNTDWNWLYNGTFIYMGWIEDASGSYEGGRTIDLWNRYSECMILLFLSMGNSDPSKGVPASAWDALTYGTGRMFPFEYAHLFPGDGPNNFAFVPNMPNTIQELGYTNSATEFHYIHAGSLHNHQYSHLFADFRARHDRWQTDFFANSISATMANRQYCINLNTHAFGGDSTSPDPYLRQPYETYGPNSWGIMAGIPSYAGYAVMQPIVMSWDDFSPNNIALNNDSGTVLLSAPLGSTPFTPRQTIDFVRNMLMRFQESQWGYEVGRYGFMNAFNLGRPYNASQIGHFAVNIIGLDMGPVVGSIENHNSGLIWKMAMRNQFIQAGMQAAGFTTGAVEPFILNFDDNPPYPNEDPNGGGRDPNSFGGYSYQFGSGSIEYFWIDDPFPDLPFGPQQWTQRISAQDNIDSGGFILLNNHDVSRWDRLSFWIRGEVGGENYNVGLKDRVIDRLGNPMQATEVKLPISKYHPSGTITSQWTEVRIPLRDFAEQGVRLTELDNISWTNLSASGGAIYVDDIAFLGDEFMPQPPQGLSVTTDGRSVTLSWRASPESDVVGYRIYRSDDEGITFTELNTLLVVETVFTDTNVSYGQHYYRITAVDNAQPLNESIPSETVPIFVNTAPLVGTITPVSGISNPNQAVTFTTTYTDPDGWQNIQYVHLLVNTAVNGTKCFYGYYNQNENKLYLRNNANNTWLGGFSPGPANTIENSYSKLDCQKTTVSGSGNTLTINWSVSFKSTFAGLKNTYLKVVDDAGSYDGWTQKGTWRINTSPQVGTINPSSGASNPNQAVSFTTTYSDADGWQDIQYVHLLVNTAVNGTKCFYGYYNQNKNKLYLRNNANNTWLGGFSPGSSNTIENSYCKLNCALTTVSGNGSTLTVKWNIVFKSTFLGTKNIYLYVKDDLGLSNGWTQKGSWAIRTIRSKWRKLLLRLLQLEQKKLYLRNNANSTCLGGIPAASTGVSPLSLLFGLR